MKHTNNTASTRRPRSTDPIQVIMTLALLPTLDGRAVLASETANGSRKFTALPAQGGIDQSFIIIDPHANNCILPGEVAWVRYDEDAGGYVPIGSTGLVREARSEEMQEAGDVKLLLPLSDTQIDARSDVDLEPEEIYLTTYMQGTVEVEGSDHRTGYWRVFCAADSDSDSDDSFDSNESDPDESDESEGSDPDDNSDDFCARIPGLDTDKIEDVLIEPGDRVLIFREGCFYFGNAKPCERDDSE